MAPDTILASIQDHEGRISATDATVTGFQSTLTRILDHSIPGLEVHLADLGTQMTQGWATVRTERRQGLVDLGETITQAHLARVLTINTRMDAMDKDLGGIADSLVGLEADILWVRKRVWRLTLAIVGGSGASGALGSAVLNAMLGG